MRPIIVMGVSGCGKTTIGQLLGEVWKRPFIDADDYHPPQNIKKMASGHPLNDADRLPWLQTLNQLLSENKQLILACSALKQSYRDLLRVNNTAPIFVYLHGEYDLIWSRMAKRENHFMRADLLRSQFDTLEMPDESEAIIVSIDQHVETIVNEISATL